MTRPLSAGERNCVNTGRPQRVTRILTVGHSSLLMEAFLARLCRYEVEVLVDIRSAPFSAYCPRFNRPDLRVALAGKGIHYSFAGGALGGKPADPALWRADGGPDYDKIAAT